MSWLTAFHSSVRSLALMIATQAACALRKLALIVCLIVYLSLMMSNFTANELEEQFNSGVLSAAEYEDFDGDGKYDLDQEDDEDGGNGSAKTSVSVAHVHPPIFKWLREKNTYSFADLAWVPQAVLFEIFQPPKALL